MTNLLLAFILLALLGVSLDALVTGVFKAAWGLIKFLFWLAVAGAALWAAYAVWQAVPWGVVGAFLLMVALVSPFVIGFVRFLNPTTEKVYNIQTLPEPMPVTTPDPLSDAAFKAWRAAQAKRQVV